MIDVRLLKENGADYRLLVCGHAEKDRESGDIVCAAVTGIVYALCGYLLNFKKSAEVIALRSGEAEIECSSDGEEAMKLALIGLCQIALSYPEHLRVCNQAFDWAIRGASELVMQ